MVLFSIEIVGGDNLKAEITGLEMCIQKKLTFSTSSLLHADVCEILNKEVDLAQSGRLHNI